MAKSKEILVADDEEHIAKLIKYKLSKAGFYVHVVKNGQELIDIFSLKKWALIILDIMMPVKNGWEVLKELNSEQCLGVSVLVLTAKGHKDDFLANAAKFGAVQYLRKPFDPGKLLSVVQQMLGDS